MTYWNTSPSSISNLVLCLCSAYVNKIYLCLGRFDSIRNQLTVYSYIAQWMRITRVFIWFHTHATTHTTKIQHNPHPVHLHPHTNLHTNILPHTLIKKSLLTPIIHLLTTMPLYNCTHVVLFALALNSHKKSLFT